MMQDRYTGDVGDFGKYGLLRALRGKGATALRLGVIWYRTDESIVEADSANDGKHIGYLRSDRAHKYRPCDPSLYDQLQGIVARNDRRVASVEETGALGAGTVFFSDYVPGPKKDASGAERAVPRRRWAIESRLATAECDLVFLDPDNGLETESTPITRAKAPKYVYFEEVQQLYNRGQSVVIYHHLARNGKHSQQIADWQERLLSHVQPEEVLALRFRRGTARAYFIVATSDHADVLAERILALVDSPWNEHFELMS